jgi:hypothetical protein
MEATMAATASMQGQVGVTPVHAAHSIPVLALGMSLSAFFVISYVICILGYLLFPGLPISHSSLSIFLPGFELLSWRTFLLGLVESFAFGWYVGLLFGSLYNFFVIRWGLGSSRRT